MSDAITSTKLEQTGENILGQPMLFERMCICVLTPANESEMRGYLVYVLTAKYYATGFDYIPPQYIRLDGLIVNFFLGIFLNIFKEVCGLSHS